MSAKDNTAQSGIYQIRCLVNGKVYIGSAASFKTRWKAHRSELLHEKHHSQHLQRAWQKHGAEQFVFEVLEAVPNKEDLIRVEQAWIDHIRSFDPEIGYNISPTAGSCLGVKQSAETCAKIGAAHKGTKRSPETRAKQAASTKKRWDDPEWVAKFADLNRKRWADPETRARIIASMKRRNAEPETKARRSAAGKKRSADPGFSSKSPIIQKGYQKSPEHIAKTAATQRGRKQSPEVVAKRIATMKANREAKRTQQQGLLPFPE